MAANHNVTVPDLGGAADVTVIEVLVKPGDKIAKDTPIVTLESDKATIEVPAEIAGTVQDIKVKVGDKVTTGAVILTLNGAEAKEKAEEPAPQKAEKKTAAAEASKTKATKEKPQAAKTKPEATPKEADMRAEQASAAQEKAPEQEVLTGYVETDSDVHAGPGVRRFARELGVNLSKVPGTGPKQRILKEDVQLFVKTQLTAPQGGGLPQVAPMLPAIDFSKFGPIESLALSRIKKISGKNLQRNWMMIPHVTQFGEADITSLEEFRLSKKAEFEKENVKLTPLVFVMKAVVASLKKFPHFNASIDITGENLVMKKYFHVGVAVDTPDGLVVPVIRDVDKKGFLDLAKELAEVSEKARKKQLTPQDMQGGSFSISSLGGIGGTAFTPIINYPEVAILGVSKSYFKPVYEDGAFVPRLTLPLSLSYDHRVIDGADGARFIVYLSSMLADIRNLLL